MRSVIEKRRAGLGAAGLLLAMAAAAAAQPSPTTLVYPPWSHCYGLHRVDQTHLTLRAGFQHRFDDPQGLCALKLAAKDDTTTSRDDDELTVFGVNSGQNEIIYNTSLVSIAFYGRAGSGVGQFDHPIGVSADRAGHVVVADTGNDRLHVLQYGADDRLHHLRFIAGSVDGARLQGPTGVALDGGEIYVTDPPHHRLLVFDLEGGLRRVLRPEKDGRPLLHEPFAVAVIRGHEELNFFGDDFLAVTDSAHARLWKLDRTGQPFAVRRLQQVAQGAHELYFVAVDYYGNVWCTDRSGRLHKFDHELGYLLSIGRPGHGDFEFDAPRGIGLYRRFGQIFVSERQGAQYLWIGTDVFTPSVAGLRALPGGLWQGTVRYFLTEYAYVSLDLVDENGHTRVALQPSTWIGPGAVTRQVEFRTDGAAGPLRVRVEAVPTYSSRKVLKVEKRTQPLALGAAAGSR